MRIFGGIVIILLKRGGGVCRVGGNLIRPGWPVSAGEVSEWLIELVSKTSVSYWGTAGSNPALSGFF